VAPGCLCARTAGDAVLPVGLVIPEFAISLCITLILSIRNLGLFSAAVFTATIGCAPRLENIGNERQKTTVYGYSIRLGCNASTTAH